MAARRVLFRWTHNSARSQMAEGLRQLGRDRVEAHSAGPEVTHVRPRAIRAMRELGIDISDQESRTLDPYLNERFDHVITVCDDGNETCPFFANATHHLHWSLPDPSKATGTLDQQLAGYRTVRDELRNRIESELLATSSP